MKFYLTKKAQLAAEAGSRGKSAVTPVSAEAPVSPTVKGSHRSRAKSVASAPAQTSSPQPRPASSRKRSGVILIGGEPRVDLLPQEVRAERKSGRSVRRAWVGVVGVAAIVILGVAGATVYASNAKTDLASAQSDTSNLLTIQSKYSPVKTAQQQADLIKAAQSVGGSTEIDWNDYLAKVQATLPTGVTVTAINLTSTSPLTSYVQATVPLQGERVATLGFTATSTELPSVPTWLDGLTTLPGFTDATPGTVAFANGIYTTTVTMHINEAAYSGRFTSKDK